MEHQRGRYAWLLKPYLIIYDILIINIFAYYKLSFNDQNLYFFSSDLLNNKHLIYFIYTLIFWVTSTSFLKFYNVHRYSSTLNVISLLIKQFLAYMVITFAFIGIFRSIDEQAQATFSYLLYAFAAVGIMKLLSFYGLKAYRSHLHGNIRNVVIIGSGKKVKELQRIFTDKKDLGFLIKAIFSNSGEEGTNGTISDSLKFLENNENVDEIYCAIDELSENDLNQYVRYANDNYCNIKFISDTGQLITKRLKTHYYGYLPVLSFQEGVINSEFNKFIKRSFDLIFSLFVIAFILSWLSVILFVLVKIESKGSLFFKHKRTGINYKQFNCYKFRSMVITKEIKGTYVKQNDERVTKIGRFLRRTSIDELPQFINVLLGQMSVVGPRPHMVSYTEDYSKKVDKYNFIFRHHVKPGITGLAQIKGCRGEIKSDQDVINRIKYDIFYIENWSLLLDLKIIFQTFLNAVKGDDKAY